MNGWAGKILDIDLTTRAVKTYPLDETLAKQFLGGAAWAPQDGAQAGTCSTHP